MAARDLTLPEWPLDLAPRTIGLSAEAAVQYGPRPGIGAPQQAMNDAGLWRVSLIDLPVYEWKILALRTLLLRMIVTSCACRIPLWEHLRSPVDLGAGVPFSDSATLGDGALFAGPAPMGSVAAAAVARASRIIVALPAGVVISAGNVIGIGDRAYCLWNATAEGNLWTLDFWPILREDISIGDEVELHSPMLVARVDRDSATQALGDLQYGRLGTLTLNFVEKSWT